MVNRFLLVASAMLAASGCTRGAGKIAEPEAPVIPISRPVQRYVTDYVEFTGRTNAKDTVSIQPRVTGYLVQMPFKEGSYVKKGDLLFEIDPRPYEAQYEAAEAQVAQSEATKRYWVATNERFKALHQKNPEAVSARELDQYQAQEDQAEANLKVAQANLISAKLNLEWTKVTAPIAGRISRYFLTHGNLVNQDVTQLTTLVSMDPMYVYFDMDESTFLKVGGEIKQGTITPPKETANILEVAASIPCILSLPNNQSAILAASIAMAGPSIPIGVPVEMGVQVEAGYPHRGVINFIDNQVNPATGSIPVRGMFPNPKGLSGSPFKELVPGMFVRIRLPIGPPHPALLIIDRAVTSDQGLKYVYVLDADNTVQQRRVNTGALQDDGLREITQGLQPDDWVIVGGIQQMRPRLSIRPERMTMPSLATPSEKEAPPGAKGKG
jgi:multidrug efflux system membrane fusion protein